jgi:hypothetical protein
MKTGTLSTLFLALALGCASSRPALRDGQPGERVTDSPREKMAGMPVPDPTADPENQDQRFGIETARDRGETLKQKREAKQRCVDVVSAQTAKGTKAPPCVPPPQKK